MELKKFLDLANLKIIAEIPHFFKDLSELLEQAAEEQFATLSLTGGGGTGPPSRAQSLYRDGSVGAADVTIANCLIPSTNGAATVSAPSAMSFSGVIPNTKELFHLIKSI